MKSREWATLGVLAIARVHGSTETTEPIPEGESAEDALRYKGGNIGALLRETTPSWQLITRVATSVWPARYVTRSRNGSREELWLFR